MRFKLKILVILALIPVFLMMSETVYFMNQANGHQSGCHRWHTCPSDTGSYTCGDLGHGCNSDDDDEDDDDDKKKSSSSNSDENEEDSEKYDDEDGSGSNSAPITEENPNYRFLKKWGSTGSDDGEFNHPASIDT